MIDMGEIFTHSDYPDIIDKFNASSCDWSLFQDLHKNISNNKCPICEVELSGRVKSFDSATIDHFRPKASNMYIKLRCEPRNYILMCRLCNENYKKSNFPLLDESKRAYGATSMNGVQHEEPLLFNPAEENPIDFFELAFRVTAQGGILELKRKPSILKGSYEYKRCETMIKLFDLGYCHKNVNSSNQVKGCRIDILAKHYKTFIGLAKSSSNKKTLFLFLKDKNRIDELKKYGFFGFIMKKQFVIHK